MQSDLIPHLEGGFGHWTYPIYITSELQHIEHEILFAYFSIAENFAYFLK